MQMLDLVQPAISVKQEPAHLIIENVIKNFPSRDGGKPVRAVNDVSLSIERGQFITLLGPSGCGKTTMLRIVSGFEQPNSGRLILKGEDITLNPPNKRDMSLVFQSYALFPHLSVFDNVAYGLKLTNMPKTTIQDRVKETIALIGLTGMEKRKPNQLSGGQQQRVALARALIMEPSVLLFDEPLSNLDATLRVQMRSEIHRLQRRLNITTLYVTHDQEEAMALSDKIIIMNQGSIEQVGSPEEIYVHPASRFVAAFMGRANFVPIDLESVTHEMMKMRIFNQTVVIPNTGDFRSGDQALAVIRPEGIRLRKDHMLAQAAVLQTMYLGASVEYVVEYQGESLTVVDVLPHTHEIYLPGQSIGIEAVPELLHVLPAGK
jgi:iron(III) transport system ATP-binding protein